MSYRSFKHLLGETSLERKCRFIFGLGILVLVSGSFFWYGQKTESLVLNQTTQTARMLVNPTIKDIHYKALGNSNFESVLETLWGDLKPLEDIPNYKARLLNPFSLNDKSKQPADDWERDAVEKFLQASGERDARRKAGNFERQRSSGVGSAVHDRKEGISVHPGDSFQAELLDGLPWRGWHSARQSFDEAGARRRALDLAQGRRPGRSGLGHLADGADDQGD